MSHRSLVGLPHVSWGGAPETLTRGMTNSEVRHAGKRDQGSRWLPPGHIGIETRVAGAARPLLVSPRGGGKGVIELLIAIYNAADCRDAGRIGPVSPYAVRVDVCTGWITMS